MNIGILETHEVGDNIVQLPHSIGHEVIEIESPDNVQKVLAAIKANELPKEVMINREQQNIEIKGPQQTINIGANQQIIFLTEEGKQELFPLVDEPQPILKFSSYSEFKSALLEYESQTVTKFILRNQSKQFTAPVCLHDILRNERNTSDLPMIRWEFCAAKDFLPIPYMGIPYITVGKQVFQCHQGKDYNTNKKHQYELRKEILNKATRFCVKSRNKGPSKKLDCPVLFAVRKLYFFPEYPLETDSKRNRAMIAQSLRARLAEIKREICGCVDKEIEECVLGKLEYLTRFPLNTGHNHDVAKAANVMKLKLKKHGTKGQQHTAKKQVSKSSPTRKE